jgi:hypothetical protein
MMESETSDRRTCPQKELFALQRIALVFMAVAIAGQGYAWADSASCDKVARLNLPHVEITMATMVAQGSHSTAGKVDRTRPLCPYPQVAKYKGSGSIDEAQNFACSAPQALPAI